MPSEVSAVTGDQSGEELRRELAEAREQQAATAEILRVISSSPTNPERVFAEIAASAARLCDAYDAVIRQVDGDVLRLVAHHGPIATTKVVPLVRGHIQGRAVLDRQTIHVGDLQSQTEYPESSDRARSLGFRAALAVPLIPAGEAIGVIIVRRTEARPFTDRQIGLLKTFADQAVIAIENTRLFEAEQTSTRELTERTHELAEALHYQTATGEVLAVISRSKFDLQPVLESIARVASDLCAADDVTILLPDGDQLLITTHHGTIPVKIGLRRPIERDWVAGRTVADRCPVHVRDLAAAGDEFPRGQQIAKQHGHRTTLGIPLLRENEAVGCILVRRLQVQDFTERQITLLQTFADQAVIAIENTRLFEAEQARNRELRVALEQQSATSEVLRVIGSSPTNAQPVFDTIVKNAVKLCNGHLSALLQFDGELLHQVAQYNYTPEALEAYRRIYPARLSRALGGTRAILDRAVVHVPDIDADREHQHQSVARAIGIRSGLFVPMMREGVAIGVIAVARSTPGQFSDNEIELLKTFADQAVIAIENTRLFEAEQASKRELQESLKYQTATSEVLAVISRSKFDLQPIIDTIVETATRLCQAKRGTLMRFEDGGFRLLPITGAVAGPITERLIDRLLPINRGSITGRVAIERRTVHILDLQADPDFTLMRGTEGDDRRTCLGVPLIAGNGLLGALVLQRTKVQPFTQEQIKLVETFADQAVIAFENTRLFDEIVRKSRELEIASQHKSQFVANMSHELRTPLAAILGYAELMQEGFYEPLGQKSLDALTRIRSNSKHLLGLINTVLDIAKIESGQFSLNLGEYAIESVVETVRVATEALAQTKKLTLSTEVAKSLPIGVGDEQRLTQVLLNLVGNAIKFTDAGQVRVTAKAVNGHFNVSVADTGPGIPTEHQTRIFEQFQQVDNSNTRAKGGTGLGLAIAKQIVEMHGGRIWVESTLGKGSTFQMELPTRAQFQERAP